MNAPNWNDLRIFAAIATSGSLTGAARQLRLSQPTVGRRLQVLETSLGTALLERVGQVFQLTAQGQALLPLVQQMEQAGQAIERVRPGLVDLPVGTVRVAAGPWNSRFIARRLTELQVDLPGIEIEIFSEYSFANLARREADIAIRNRRPEKGRLAVRRLPEPSYAVFGARSYVEAHPASQGDERYRHCSWIGFDETQSFAASLKWVRNRIGRWPHIRCSHSATIYDALVGGAGLAVIPCFAGSERSDLVRLTPPLDDLEGEGLWMVIHEDVRDQLRVRKAADALGGLFKRHLSILQPDRAD